MNGERRLRLFERLHRHPKAGPGDQHACLRESRRVAAADDSADRALAADRRDLRRAASGQLDGHRNHRRSYREQAGVDLSAALRAPSRRPKARPFRRRARAAPAPLAENVESRRLPVNAASALVSSSVVTSTKISRGRRTDRYECGRSRKCARAQVAPSAADSLDVWCGGRPAGSRQPGGRARHRRGCAARR